MIVSNDKHVNSKWNKMHKSIHELLDKDLLRKRLKEYLEENHRIAFNVVASKVGLSHVAFLNFLHGRTEPRRKTLGLIREYLTREHLKSVENNPVNVHIKLDKNEEPAITIEE